MEDKQEITQDLKPEDSNEEGQQNEQTTETNKDPLDINGGEGEEAVERVR